MHTHSPQHDDVLFVGRTPWTDAEHWPCPDASSCPFGHGNLPRHHADPMLFGIRARDRRRHLLALGASGQGKTTLLYNMLLQDIAAGRGVALIDPHGDLARDVMSAIPRSRTRDVVYFDPADADYPVGLNVLEAAEPKWHTLVADHIVAVFRNIWEQSWGPRMEEIFQASVLSLLQIEGSTLLGVHRILTDKPYRAWVVSQLSDSMLRRFWSHEYDTMGTRLEREAIGPILNKIGQFLLAPPIRHVVGQSRPKVDIRRVMDTSGIFIANLSKGTIGERGSSILASLLVTKFLSSAMRRADMPEERRVDFFLMADEIHNIAGDILQDIFAEARKYCLAFAGATQYVSRLSAEVRSSAIANVATTVAFRMGAEDAELLASSYAPRVTPEDLQGTARHEFYIKLAIANEGVTMPFHARSLPPLHPPYKVTPVERILRVSRERWARPRRAVEYSIETWLATQGPVKEERRGTRHTPPHPQPPSRWWKRVTP